MDKLLEFVVLYVNSDAGDDGDYNGSVIGSYYGTIKAETQQQAIEKLRNCVIRSNKASDDFDEEDEVNFEWCEEGYFGNDYDKYFLIDADIIK